MTAPVWMFVGPFIVGVASSTIIYMVTAQYPSGAGRMVWFRRGWLIGHLPMGFAWLAQVALSHLEWRP